MTNPTVLQVLVDKMLGSHPKEPPILMVHMFMPQTQRLIGMAANSYAFTDEDEWIGFYSEVYEKPEDWTEKKLEAALMNSRLTHISWFEEANRTGEVKFMPMFGMPASSKTIKTLRWAEAGEL